jgi:hypothetical protein
LYCNSSSNVAPCSINKLYFPAGIVFFYKYFRKQERPLVKALMLICKSNYELLSRGSRDKFTLFKVN